MVAMSGEEEETTMSDEEEEKSGKRHASSPAESSKEIKTQRQVSPTTQHVSVLPANQMASPFLIANTRLMETHSPVTIEKLYNMVKQLDQRVTSQGTEISSLKEKLCAKNEENGVLQQQLAEARATVPIRGEAAASVIFSKTDKDFLETMRKSIPDISEGLGKAEQSLTELGNNLKNFEKDIHEFQKQLRGTAKKCNLEGDQRDQYSRRDTIRVDGVPYKRGENTNLLIARIAEAINVRVMPSDISVSHRSGKPNAKGIRPIICRFARRDVKHQIMDCRRLTKNIRHDDDHNPVQIFIDEHLTPMRAGICKKLRSDKIAHYTRDGKIFINFDFNENQQAWKVFDSPSDWENLPWSESEKISLGLYPKD